MPDVIVNKNGVFIDTHVRYRTISDNLSKQEYKFLLTTTLTISVDPIYPKMNLSKRMQQAKVCPYLLRNAVIDRPNQAWSIDITYIPIKHGFLYLTAIIDWYSRCIVGWEVDDTLDTRMVINALKKAFKASQILHKKLALIS